MISQSAELKIAIEAAKKGAEKALEYFGNNLQVEYKENNTPVTIADRETENTIMEFIKSNFPNTNFFGEENGGNLNQDEFWIIDPIDGTKSFIRGIPTWSVIVSLCRHKKVLLTAVYYPLINTIYLAEKGEGAYVNDKRIFVSKVSDLKKAYLGYGGLGNFENLQPIINVMKTTSGSRSWETTYSSCLVAEGKMDINIDNYGNVWDVAPFKLMIEEAGGKITRLNGDEWNLKGHGAVITNGLLHDKVLEILNNNK